MTSAAVLGGGIAGLTAGTALVQARWQVNVFERAPQLGAVGAALSLWPNATAGLERLGVLDEVRRRGMPIRAMLLADRRERPIIPARQVDGEAFTMTRADLQDVLARELPGGALALDREVVAVSDDGDGVQLRFADGRFERFDLVVDAGGLRSIAADIRPVTYRGYAGVVALSDPVGDVGLNGLAAEYWGWRERFGLFELPGNRRYWFFMRDAAADAIAPSRDEILARAARFPPAIARAVEATPSDRLIPYPIHARPAPRSLGHGRVIRVGDAAHAMEPNLGSGLVDHSQKMTVAARVMAAKKAVGQRS